MTSKGSECSRIAHHLLGFIYFLLHVIKENVMQVKKGSNLSFNNFRTQLENCLGLGQEGSFHTWG